MLHRSLPRQVHAHLERITRSPLPVGEDAVAHLPESQKHEKVVEVMERLQRLMLELHPKFYTNRVYEQASVCPEMIAYWLADMARETEERFCGINPANAPVEHWGKCDVHRRHLLALFRAFLRGMACDAEMESEYREHVHALAEIAGRRGTQQIDRLLSRLPLPDHQRELIRKSVEECFLDADLAAELVDELWKRSLISGGKVTDEAVRKTIDIWRARRGIVLLGCEVQ